MSANLRPCLVFFVVAFLAVSGYAVEAPAERLLQQGHADEAARLLQETLARNQANPPAHQLLCRVFLSEDMPDPGIAECELAVAQKPNDSGNQMWLGRAYGLKADKAGPLTGLNLAKKVRVAFESAAELDPANLPAQAALGEFYIAAPPLIGGGLDKAQRVATHLERFSPAGAYRLRAMAAEKAKDAATAEVEFRLAAATARTPQAWVDLGDFYQRQKQPDKAVAALQSAIDVNPAHDSALVDVASVLTDLHRSPEQAENVLRLYLASPNKSEAAPAFKVHVQLGRLLAKHGDTAGARAEYAAALELASSYAPARKAMERL